MSKRRLLMLALAFAATSCLARGQRRMVAYVPTEEATASGVLTVAGDNSLLGDDSVITALDRPAHVTLSRGGALLVCQTGVVELTAGQSPSRPGADSKSKVTYDPLLILLESGSLEIRMPILPSDTVTTPQMRFSSAERPGKAADLDLVMRVSPNGNTCVENRGKKAPPLHVTDLFGRSSYVLKAGQHVLFQNGLIQQVVDAGTTSCDCPPAAPPGLSIADAALRAGAGASPTFDRNASAFPFPVSSSESGESSSSLSPEQPEQAPVQVAATLTYNPADALAALDPAAAIPPVEPVQPPGRHKLAMPPAHRPTTRQPPAPVPTPPQPASATQPKRHTHHSIGGFFRKLFGRS